MPSSVENAEVAFKFDWLKCKVASFILNHCFPSSFWKMVVEAPVPTPACIPATVAGTRKCCVSEWGVLTLRQRGSISMHDLAFSFFVSSYFLKPFSGQACLAVSDRQPPSVPSPRGWADECGDTGGMF